MKKILVILLAAMTLALHTVYAQDCINITNENISSLGILSGNTVTLQAGKTYCVENDLPVPGSHEWQNREFVIEEGAVLHIKPGGKLFIKKFKKSGSHPAGHGTFRAIVEGQLTIGESEIATNGVNISIENGGIFSRGNESGSTSYEDIKLISSENDNLILVKEGGRMQAGTLTISGKTLIENNSTVDIRGNMNINAETIIKNNYSGTLTIHQHFSLNPLSKIINCGEVLLRNAFNLNGGEIVNTHTFISENGQINMGSGNGGIIRNYGDMKIKSINISSTSSTTHTGYFYNEGIVEITETSNNAFGANVGKITGPANRDKKGYFILNASDRTMLGHISISGNLNFYQKNATTHSTLADVFMNYNPSDHNLDLATVTLYPCDGSEDCAAAHGMPIAVRDYGSCPDADGSLGGVKLTLAHDPEGDGSYNGSQLEDLSDMYAYLISEEGVILEKIILASEGTALTRSGYINDSSHMTGSGTSRQPEQVSYKNLRILLSTLDAEKGDDMPPSVSPQEWVFTVNDENQSPEKEVGAEHLIRSIHPSNINFGIQKRPEADDKVWYVRDYEVNTFYTLGSLTGSIDEETVSLSGEDSDGEVIGYQLQSFPSESIAVLYYEGEKITEETIIKNIDAITIEFTTAAPPQLLTISFLYVSIDNAQTTSITPALYEIILGDPDNPLPVEGMTLSAKAFNNIHILDWTVIDAGKHNIQKFIIERSSDGVHFSTIGEVSAADKYYFEDKSPLISDNYYRIAVQKVTGDKSYSHVVKIDAAHSISMEIYPNPASDVLFISFSDDKTYRIQIIDASGRNIYQGTKTDNQKVTAINVSQLTSGNYFVIITDKDGRSSSRLLVK